LHRYASAAAFAVELLAGAAAELAGAQRALTRAAAEDAEQTSHEQAFLDLAVEAAREDLAGAGESPNPAVAEAVEAALGNAAAGL
jgi:hypothetical protein